MTRFASYAERRASLARRTRQPSPAQRRHRTSALLGVAGCILGLGAVAAIAFADLGPPDANRPYGAAPSANAPISFNCGAFDVTYQAHDVASRDDVWHSAPRGCTLVANPDFRAGAR